MPRDTRLRSSSAQAASDSLLPTSKWSKCLRPSASMPQATRRAPLAPWARNAGRVPLRVTCPVGEDPASWLASRHRGGEGLVEVEGLVVDSALGGYRVSRASP
jgi:hypothetical protein